MKKNFIIKALVLVYAITVSSAMGYGLYSWFTICLPGSNPKEYQSTKICVDKTIEKNVNGYTNYVIAFDDMTCKTATFGQYVNINKGDTVEFKIYEKPFPGFDIHKIVKINSTQID